MYINFTDLIHFFFYWIILSSSVFSPNLLHLVLVLPSSDSILRSIHAYMHVQVYINIYRYTRVLELPMITYLTNMRSEGGNIACQLYLRRYTCVIIVYIMVRQLPWKIIQLILSMIYLLMFGRGGSGRRLVAPNNSAWICKETAVVLRNEWRATIDYSLLCLCSSSESNLCILCIIFGPCFVSVS